MRRNEEGDVFRNIPREVRALMDHTHINSRHNDGELPPRRGNRPTPRERGLNVEDVTPNDNSNYSNDHTMKGVEDKVESAEMTPPIHPLSANQPTSSSHPLHLQNADPTSNNDSISIPLIDAIDFALSTSYSSEPKSLKEALSRPDADKWITAAAEEIKAHLKNKTREL